MLKGYQPLDVSHGDLQGAAAHKGRRRMGRWIAGAAVLVGLAVMVHCKANQCLEMMRGSSAENHSDRGSEETLEGNPGCKVWFNGCNRCIVFDSKELGCDRKFCSPESMGKPKCLSFEDEKGPAGEPVAEEKTLQVTAPEGCKLWFNGCNRCRVLEDGLACDRKFCPPDMMEEAGCLSWSDDEQAEDPEASEEEPAVEEEEKIVQVAVPEGCKVWFNGCNRCKVLESGLACDRKFCLPDRMEKPECLSFEDSEQQAEVQRKSQVPEKCQVWFNGCNMCRRAATGGPLACDRKFCPPALTKPANCIKYFT